MNASPSRPRLPHNPPFLREARHARANFTDVNESRWRAEVTRFSPRSSILTLWFVGSRSLWATCIAVSQPRTVCEPNTVHTRSFFQSSRHLLSRGDIFPDSIVSRRQFACLLFVNWVARLSNGSSPRSTRWRFLWSQVSCEYFGDLTLQNSRPR